MFTIAEKVHGNTECSNFFTPQQFILNMLGHNMENIKNLQKLAWSICLSVCLQVIGRPGINKLIIIGLPEHVASLLL